MRLNFCRTVYHSSYIIFGIVKFFFRKRNIKFLKDSGVFGIIFAAIALVPQLRVNFIPGWLFGTIYFGYSVCRMLDSRTGDNVGHAAHLGGAIFGISVIALLKPLFIVENALYLGIMALP